MHCSTRPSSLGTATAKWALRRDGKISLTPLPLHLLQDRRQFYEVGDAEVRAARGHRYERVKAFDVGPAGGDGGDTLFAGPAEEDPVLAPSVGEADQLVLLAVQRVERVCYTEPLPNAAATSS